MKTTLPEIELAEIIAKLRAHGLGKLVDAAQSERIFCKSNGRVKISGLARETKMKEHAVRAMLELAREVLAPEFD